MQIAIDGPGSSGKSSIAKLLARKLNFLYIDTGAMYRALALYTIEKEIQEDKQAIVNSLKDININLAYKKGSKNIFKVFLNNRDVTDKIKTQQVGEIASKIIANIPEARDKVTKLSQEQARLGNTVMDGRDIGTVVLPNAELKIFLTADVNVRAQRRLDELLAKGHKHSLEEIKAEITARDHRDITREISPLKQADDARVIDATYMTLEEVTDYIAGLCQ